jgi:hypothetical protein
MTYEQFLEVLLMSHDEFSIGSWSDFYLSEDGTSEHNRTLCKRWISGGQQGGGHWGTNTYTRSPDPEPEFSALTSLLMHFAPALTFLQYQKIIESQEIDSTCETEYYGNSTEYSIKYIKLEELYNLLVEWGYIQNV